MPPIVKIVTTEKFGIRTDGGRVMIEDPVTGVKDVTASLLKSGNLNGNGLINVFVTVDPELANANIGVADMDKADFAMDMLDEIFKMQAELNDAVFAKKRFMVEGNLALLTTAHIRACTARGEFGPNDLPNVWLNKYLQALMAEAEELKASLLWKWWSKDKIDMQNARVEIIDMLHFLLSLALVAGLDAHEVFRLYKAKHAINHKRQEEGYSQATKTEADNKTVV